MKFIALSLLIFCLRNFSFAQAECPVNLYASTTDFINDKKVPAIALIVQISDKHIKVENFHDTTTNKPIKRSVLAWALEYKGEKYFNLHYSHEMRMSKVFIKFDLIGKWCAVVMDETTPNRIRNEADGYADAAIVGGLTGVLIKQANNTNRTWHKMNNEKAKILLINTGNIKTPYALGYFLTRNQLNVMLKSREISESANELLIEEIIEIIKKQNAS